MKKTVNILQVGMTDNIGGMETYLINQYRQLNRNKIEYDFVNITGDRHMVFEEEIKDAGNQVYKICRRSKNPFKHYYDWWKLLKKQRGKYDAIVLNACHLYYVFPLVIGRIMGIKIRIMHSHNSGDELQINVLRQFIVWLNSKLMFWAATDCWACSNAAGKWMFRNRKFIIIHNAIDTRKFTFNEVIRNKKRKELKIEGKFVVGHVGRFTYQKNHKFLITVFSEACKKNSNMILLLVGDAVGIDKEYLLQTHEMVNQLGLQDKVLFLGMRTDVNELMQAMDCFLLPSHFEGLPVVGVEAQAAGLPCFFSNTITPDLSITSLVHYCNNSGLTEWVDSIFEYCNYKRNNMQQQITNSGYDIATEIYKIEQFYLNRCSHGL
ncbi:glycosyltransferase family 1 protein [Megasphaera sueciensis]|uniref:glycosyltransferase family 1 protein n=1 Tax=Megasphaera sueciensis TaxID=349094 RepID=UPI003D0324E4